VTASRQRLLELLEPVVTPTGHDLEEVTVTPAGRRSVVRVIVDRDGGISLDDVADVSRVVSEALDALDASEPGALGSSYVLEVTSPGVDRPLTAPRHWRRNVGRLVKTSLTEGETVTGRVVSADDAEDGAVTLDVDGQARAVPYAALDRGMVQVEFGRGSDGGDA
jgi:ribosome maturation factor RimP